MASIEFTPEQIAEEEWYAVADYEGYYSVSDLGRIRRDRPYLNTPVSKIITPHIGSSGYQNVCLCKNNVRTTRNVHSIVALAFLGKRPEGWAINHKDGNKINNCAINLEYLTYQDNSRHALRNKLMPSVGQWQRDHPDQVLRGERVWNAKHTEKQAAAVKKMLRNGQTSGQITKNLHVSRDFVFNIKYGRGWKHIS